MYHPLSNGILGRQHKEGFIQFVGCPSYRNSLFLHGLQQCGLCFGRCSVDLVSQDNVSKNRPFDEPEVARFIQNLGSDDVGRHQVGSELNAAVRKPK